MEIKIQLDPQQNQLELFGTADQHLKMIRAELDIKITARKGDVKIVGTPENVRRAADIIDHMQKKLIKHGSINTDDIDHFLTQSTEMTTENANTITVYSGKKVIEPATKAQLKYIETMRAKDLTFCTGPAGTGKTYLAVAVAVSMLKLHKVKKIVLARPAVEAGEKLGFLPGDIQQKVNPYLRPLFDALGDMMSFTQMKKYIDLDIIEVIPLAFMRGRTLNQAAIICDEAQNTSSAQMLMLLTRLGRGSKMIVTGDVTQIDLEKGQKSGLIEAIETLKGIRAIGNVKLGQIDIVRHKLVTSIVNAYSKNKEER
jgi:phosphate starvation-inducible PhoH-like protein